MSFLHRLLGKPKDPTTDWGEFRLPIPDFDVTAMQFGTLRFGDPFEAAGFLGRPDRCEWTQRQYCELLYAGGGFQMDFAEGKLAYLAFFVGPDAYQPEHGALAFSQPRLRGGALEGIRLSLDTDRAMLERLFGAADTVDAELDEVILFYAREGVTMEFEIDGKTGRLKRWNLFPQEDL